MHFLHWAFLCIAALGQVTWATPAHHHGRQVQPRQLDDPDYRPDCVTYSFSYPLFRIYDPIWQLVNRTTGGNHGDFWFTIHNMATNIQVECEMKNVDLFTSNTTWHYCKDNSTQFHMSIQTDDFQLKQSWTCNSSA